MLFSFNSVGHKLKGKVLLSLTVFGGRRQWMWMMIQKVYEPPWQGMAESVGTASNFSPSGDEKRLFEGHKL